MKYIFKAALFALSLLFSSSSIADEALTIVTDPWPPHAYLDDGNIAGVDVDVALAVFEKMGINATITLMPWKRCLAVVKSKKADAILAAAITDERKTFLHFPQEPISSGDTIFFKQAGNPITEIDLENKEGLDVGSVLGYKYCDQLDNSKLILDSTRVASVEQNFKKLLLGRIDLLVAAEPVGYFRAKEMDIAGKVAVVPNARYCYGGNYLAFSQKPGHDQLSIRFSEELIKFKQTQVYKDILLKYGMPLSLKN